jgi:hypothetical protein
MEPAWVAVTMRADPSHSGAIKQFCVNIGELQAPCLREHTYMHPPDCPWPGLKSPKSKPAFLKGLGPWLHPGVAKWQTTKRNLELKTCYCFSVISCQPSHALYQQHRLCISWGKDCWPCNPS